MRTTMLGADYTRGRLVAGLSMARSQGLGGYGGRHPGRVESTVTGLYPWLGYKVNDRVSVWGDGLRGRRDAADAGAGDGAGEWSVAGDGGFTDRGMSL
ncbi:MAG: hypothetical protein J4G16_05755, partial [Acidobacteria bacterium]|nr:hypothetical protein [Acidobacteriota bacterium]